MPSPQQEESVSPAEEIIPTASALYNSYHSQLENLKKLPVPYSDIYHALSSHESIPLHLLGARFKSAVSSLNLWLETAERAVFGLELDVQQEGTSDKRDVGEIDVIMNRFQPNIDMLIELKERIEFRLKESSSTLILDEEHLDANGEQETPLTEEELQRNANNIGASWKTLKELLEKVKGDLAGAKICEELLTHMANVLKDIEEICGSIDVFQTERSRLAACADTIQSTTTPSSPPSVSSADSTDELENEKQRNMEMLARMDSRIELLTSRIDILHSQIRSLPAKGCTESREILEARYQQIQSRWDDLKFRRERVSEELKEDRWLAVFEQVAGQVESMMESMERAIVHCKGLIDQIKSMVREKVIPNAPVDRDHLYTIFKSFEAKHKYYAPAVNKMLNMLESGIESRMTRNTDVIRKHQTMKFKWEQLQSGLERVELELNGVERLLDVLDASIPCYLPTPPTQLPEKPLFSMRRSQAQTGWKSPGPQPLFQPPQQQQVQRGRRPPPSTSLQSPTSTPRRSRTRSPTSNSPHQRPWSPATSISSHQSTSYSQMLSPSALNNYRSLSPSPSRSPSRVSSDKPRPWCPSQTVTSPGIPGIPHLPSVAATYIPRPVSVVGQYRDRSPSRALDLTESAATGTRSTSSVGHRSTSIQGPRTTTGTGNRSASCAPTLTRVPVQYKPPFSPSGSLSKLSTGVQKTTTTTTNPSRKSSLSVSSVEQSSRSRQHSAPGISTGGTPRPNSRGYSREPPSGSVSSSTSRLPAFSPPVPRQRRLSTLSMHSNQSVQSAHSNQSTGGGDGSDREKRPTLARLSNMSLMGQESVPRLSRPRQGSLCNDDKIDSAYGSEPGSASFIDSLGHLS